MSEEQKQDILTQLGVKDISKQNEHKFYKFAVYGKFGTGKTTFLTKDNNALVLDINEDGTTVTEDAAVDMTYHTAIKKTVTETTEYEEVAYDTGNEPIPENSRC